MPPTAFRFAILLTGSLVSMVSTRCTHSLTCPCGNTRRVDYYTHCLNDTLGEKITCKRWANCQSCEANVLHCLTCLPERSGPTCAEVKRKTCPDPGVPEGGSRQNEGGTEVINTYPAFFREGESVYFSCNEEVSVLKGSPVITCTSSGTWSDSLPLCQKAGVDFPEKPALEKFCKYPGVDANGIIEDLTHSVSLEDGPMFPSTTRLKFKCKEGYRLEGQNALFCLCSGEWTADPPTCVPEVSDHSNLPAVHCEGRGPILNGRVTEYRDLDRQFPFYEEYGALYPVETYLHYSCNKGYTLRGKGFIVCESSGLWSAKEPKCIEELNLSQTPAPNDDNLNKNFVPNDNNPIRNFLSNEIAIGTKHNRQSTVSSNSLIFKFFFF